MKKMKPSKCKQAVAAHDIAASAGIRTHKNGDIELLDQREAQTVVHDMLREAFASAFSRDPVRRKVH